MGLFDAIDSFLGTDLTGKKAQGYYEQGAKEMQGYNQKAVDTIKQYGQKALDRYTKYVNKGMNAEDALREAAIQAVQAGEKEAVDAYNQQYNAGMEARQPYEQAGTDMLGALPYLQSAMGLPSSQQYDVQASPMYQWQKDQMDKELTAQANAMGIQNAPASMDIRQQGLQSLGAAESQRQLANLYNMVGMGANMTQSLGQPQFQAARDLSGLYVASSGMEANMLNQAALNRGQTYNNMGMNAANVDMGIGSNIANSYIGQGQSAMNMGISRAQQPNAMNQLLNTGIGLLGMGAFNGGRGNSRMDTTPIAQSGYQNYGLPFMRGMSGIPGL